jgi:hypothetical protein
MPAFILTRVGFTQVVNNAFAGMGFIGDAATLKEFPIDMFVEGSDLTPLKENIDKVVYGLTKWSPKTKDKGLVKPPKVTVQGKDYQEAAANMNFQFLKNMWSDGLPILPATEERVNWLLTGTDIPRDKIVGKILPKGGIATVEMCAVSLAMTGGRPEYLPVLIASMESILDPPFFHQHMNSTTCSTYAAVIVNGPVAKQIRLNSGYGCLGPSSEYPAGAAIGRAIRLLLINVGGGIPGVGSMAIFGGANRYTNIVFAEDEEGIPKSWKPLNASFFNYSPGTNTVAAHTIAGTANINGTSVGTEETARTTLGTLAGMMNVPNKNYFTRLDRFEKSSPGIMLIGRGTAQGLAEFGWTKEKVKDYLWEHSKVPWSMIEKSHSAFEKKELLDELKPYVTEGKPVPITSKPKNILLVVAGGEQSGHGYWMQLGTSYEPTCKQVKLPAKWSELLKQAEKDLGPLPAR